MEKYVYEGGYFINLGNSRWEEWQNNHLAFRFVETSRDAAWIYLRDEDRKITVALMVTGIGSYYRFDNADWVFLYNIKKVIENDPLFQFQLIPGETINDRVVRCCTTALKDGQIGQYDRHDFYRTFISCNQEKTIQAAENLTRVRTSCAMFVRAVRHWCGCNPTGPYKVGTGMFVSMGNVNYNHPAYVSLRQGVDPRPGDYFYISTKKDSNDGHTGIFIAKIGANTWTTAEGGGGGREDGTLCRFKTRHVANNRFHDDPRILWGWFDCNKVNLPVTL